MRLRDLGMTEEKWIHEGSWTIPVVGTLGVLLAAKRGQLLAEVAPVIARMELLGMFVSVRLRDEVLRIAGEKG